MQNQHDTTNTTVPEKGKFAKVSIDESYLIQLGHKAKKIWGARIIDKAIVRSAGMRVPYYVAEHIIAKYCYQNNDIKGNVARLREEARLVTPTPDNRESIKVKIFKDKTHNAAMNDPSNHKTVSIYDKLVVHIDTATGNLVGALENLGATCAVHQSTVEQFPELLNDGIWCCLVLYGVEAGGKATILIRSITPLQYSNVDLEEYKRLRYEFTNQEWVDLLVASLGYNPVDYNYNAKIVLLLRLLPLIEPNFNMLELGPRQTGKTYLLRNFSNSVYVASGANISAATLFHNIATRDTGILGHYKVAVLDEISNTTFDGPAVVSMLKDYMESGQYGRGGITQTSDASIVMTGNIDIVGNGPDPRYTHWFEPLPTQLKDLAFLDRINCYIPGWEIPKIRTNSIFCGQAFAIDYLGRVLQALRKEDYRDQCHRYPGELGLTRRDIVSVEKITSGLIKLMNPDGNVTDEQIASQVSIAQQLRGNVTHQLAIMSPGEFGQYSTVKYSKVV